jgi:hypothetical protein
MKAIDKSRFKQFLPADEQGLSNSAGAAPEAPRWRAICAIAELLHAMPD